MWRFIFHSTDPTPELEGAPWPPCLLPQAVPFEAAPGQPGRGRVGGWVVELRRIACPDCDCRSPGPAFELSADDGLPADLAMRLFDDLMASLQRAAVAASCGGSFGAHGRGVERPAETYPRSDPNRAAPGT